MKQVFFLISLLLTCSCLPDYNKIVDRINFARTDPQAFALLISARYNNLPDAAAAVQYLQTSPTLPALTVNQGVHAAAQLHANYLKTRTVLTIPYMGCTGSHIENRINQVGTLAQVGENIVTMIEDEEEIVVKWIIDADSFNKVNRRNIFEKGFDVIGVGVSDGPYSKNIVVVDFAGGFMCNDPCPNVPTQDVGYYCTANPYTYGNSGIILSARTVMTLFGLVWLIVCIF